MHLLTSSLTRLRNFLSKKTVALPVSIKSPSCVLQPAASSNRISRKCHKAVAAQDLSPASSISMASHLEFGHVVM